MIVTTTLFMSCLKLLLLPAYRSTDFEVHRNWLAITHNLPINKWYFENTSEWTLDYPPLFAWFEYVLSQFARFFDDRMLIVDNLNYASKSTIIFQRLSVIVTDLVFSYAVYRCSRALPKGWRNEVVLPIILLTNAGLVMVDHIHFQYNGILFGVLLLSISYMLEQKYLASAFWFCILLNMKHIYMYFAPAYFVYLLRNFCLGSSPFSYKNIGKLISIRSTFKLGAVVLSVFFITYAPFYNHLSQIFSRLFPFKRGLCHAYWAPNFWALYNLADKTLYFILTQLKIVSKSKPVASMTGGLVQEFSHSILPDITPSLTILLTVTSMLPALVKLWLLREKPLHFVRCLVLCGLTSFLFGWHVHEKAILMTIIPLSILSVIEVGDAKVFVLLSIIGHCSLFPLLFPASLLPIKVLLLILHSTYVFQSLSSMYPLQICKYNFPLLNTLESIYVLGFIVIFLYENIIHWMVPFLNGFPFIPLMLTSVYCALGVVYCWIKYYLYFILYKNTFYLKSKKVK